MYTMRMSQSGDRPVTPLLMRAVVLMCLVVLPTMGATRYAEVSGATSGSCDSWGSACTLSYAVSVASVGDEVWVEAGTYGPIALKNGVKIFGGFNGTESAASDSDPATNQTIIDGGGNRAVLSEDDGPSTMLRGFTIKNGRVTGFLDQGGGLLMTDSSAMIVQCVFEDNTADFFGGAVSVGGASSAQFVSCIFRNNGAMTIGEDTIDTIAGAGVFVSSGSVTLTNCLLYGNKSGDGAAIAIADGTASLYNCTVANNQATVNAGGGIFDQEGIVTIRNSVFWGNAAAKSGAQIFNYPNYTTDVAKSDIQGGYTGTGNIDSDPSFTDSGAGDFSLQSTSPCINTGQLTALPLDVADLDWDANVSEKVPLDLAGNNRKYAGTPDMGAYESQYQAGGGGQ